MEVIHSKDSITEEHAKEGISLAYVTAIAHTSGLNLERSEFDYGIDGTFSSVRIRGNRRVSTGIKLDFQLKASTNVVIEGDYIKYNLEAKNYNDLVDEEVGTPRILLLYKLPKEREHWMDISENQTTLKNCAFWCSLKGEDSTCNVSSKSIRIPRNQILTVESLKELMEKVKEGDEL